MYPSASETNEALTKQICVLFNHSCSHCGAKRSINQLTASVIFKCSRYSCNITINYPKPLFPIYQTYPKDQFWMLGRLQTTRLGDVFNTNVSLQCVRVCLAVRSDAPYIMFAILGTAPATRNVCPNTQKHTDDRKTPGVQENSDGQSRLTVLVNSL